MPIYSKKAPKSLEPLAVWEAVPGSKTQVFVRYRDSRGDLKTTGPLRVGWHSQSFPPNKNEGDVLVQDWEGNWLRLYFLISGIRPYDPAVDSRAELFLGPPEESDNHAVESS